MNAASSRKLAPGLYHLHWRDGSSSLAAVGILHNGRRWFAPCNWTSVAPMGIACSNWHMVSRAEPVK